MDQKKCAYSIRKIPRKTCLTITLSHEKFSNLNCSKFRQVTLDLTERMNMDNRMKFYLALCCITIVGCSVAYLEDRFDHDHLGGLLRISQVKVVEADNVVFEFSKDELAKLENEIGRMSVFDITTDDQNNLINPTEKDLWFSFSDGFKLQVDHEFGTVDGVCILRIGLPDNHGFGGDIPVFTNLNGVLDHNRLDEIKNVLGSKESDEISER